MLPAGVEVATDALGATIRGRLIVGGLGNCELRRCGEWRPTPLAGRVGGAWHVRVMNDPGVASSAGDFLFSKTGAA